MIHITKYSTSLSFIHRYSRVFDVVSSCHAVDVRSVSDFVPNPINHVHIYGRNLLFYPYPTIIFILWDDFFVILGPEFSVNGSGRLRLAKQQTTLYMLRTSIRLHYYWKDF
jgi:hypothetical protein